MLSITATKNLTASISGVFNSFAFAISELLSTILIICIIVAMSQVLKKTGINEVMVAPFTKIIKTPTLGFWTIGILMMVISWFFWPSPAVALLGAVLLPVAIRAGLPALGVPKHETPTAEPFEDVEACVVPWKTECLLLRYAFVANFFVPKA